MYQYVRENAQSAKQRIEGPFFDWFQKLILLLLFMMAMDFRNKFFYWAFASFGMMALYQRKELHLPRMVIPAVVLAISFSLFAPSTKDSILGMLRPFAYPFCIIIGYELTSGSSTRKRETQITVIILILAAGAFGHYLLNMLINLGGGVQRNTIDIWTGMERAATGQAALACLMVGVNCGLLFCETKLITKAISVLTLAVIIAYNLQLAGRSLFILIIIAVVIAFAVRFKLEKYSQARIKMLVGGFAIIMVVLLLISVNAFGIVDMLSESNFYSRFYGEFSNQDIAADGRMTTKLKYLKHMGEAFWGGGNVRRITGSYAHDAFLDTYDEAGLFALISITILICSDVCKCIRIYESRVIGLNTKVLFVTVFCILMVQFMLEPILIGTQWLMASYCVISGSLGGLIEKS